MGQPVAVEPFLGRFREALAHRYGPRLARVVLFGSRARGDFDADSDYDVAVFIRDAGSLWDEAGVIAPLATPFLLSDDALIAAMPFPAEQYDDGSPLMREIARDGLDL